MTQEQPDSAPIMFRPPKPRQFQYHFVYSDPAEEERRKRIRFVRAEARRAQEAEESGEQAESFSPLFGMHARRSYLVQRNRRMVYILAVLVALTLWILLS